MAGDLCGPARERLLPKEFYRVAQQDKCAHSVVVGDVPSIDGGNMAHLKRNNYKELYRKDYIDSPSIDSMMREVLHMIGNIDFEYQVELDKVEKNMSDHELKDYIKRKIEAAHREKREPYVALLTQLRQRQHRLALN